MPVFMDTVIARVVSHQAVCSPHQVFTLLMFSFCSHLKWLHCFCFSPLAAVVLICCTLIGTHTLSLAAYFSTELPVWRLQPLLFLLISQKSWLLLHITEVANMSSGVDNEMNKMKMLKWLLCPEPFKQKPTIWHSHKPNRTLLQKELLYKYLLICNYM